MGIHGIKLGMQSMFTGCCFNFSMIFPFHLGSFGSTGPIFFWVFQTSPVMVGLWLGLPQQ